MATLTEPVAQHTRAYPVLLTDSAHSSLNLQARLNTSHVRHLTCHQWAPPGTWIRRLACLIDRRGVSIVYWHLNDKLPTVYSAALLSACCVLLPGCEVYAHAHDCRLASGCWPAQGSNRAHTVIRLYACNGDHQLGYGVLTPCFTYCSRSIVPCVVKRNHSAVHGLHIPRRKIGTKGALSDMGARCGPAG